MIKIVQDVFWDAMIECGVPWFRYGSLLHHVSQTLGEGIDRCSFGSLEDYSTEEITSKRHYQSAKVALRVFEAMNIVTEWTNAYHEWRKAVELILSSTKDYS